VTSNTNRGSAIGEVGLKTGKSGVRYSETGVQAGKEDLVVYGVHNHRASVHQAAKLVAG